MLRISDKRKDVLIKYCEKEGISFEKLMKCPKFYNNEMLGFQKPVISKETNGLLNDTPEEPILLLIEEDGAIKVSKSEDILDYLAI